MVGIKAGAY